MSEQVYTGRWIDWSYGPILGDRITVPGTQARYLIAFLAIFNTWVGAGAWTLLAFIVHQALTIQKARIGASHQLHVALRNATTPTAFIEQAVFIAWAWRKVSARASRNASLMTIIPIIITILFIAVGIGSSRIATTNGDVLLLGGDCGLVNPNVTSASDELQIQFSQEFQDGMRMSLSNNYARQCYNNSLDNSSASEIYPDASRSACGGYTQTSLPIEITVSTACPFEDACLGSDIIRLDTGPLDSHFDLGMNQPEEDRVSFRKVTTCAPLKTYGFSDNGWSVVDSLSYLGNISVYSYGNNTYQPTRFGGQQALPYADATFVYSKDTYTASQYAYYTMIASTMQMGTSGPLYQPLSSISSNSSKPMTLVFLANRAFYQDVVTDAWFNATVPIHTVENGETEDTFYQSGNPGSVLGCTEQLQICNPNAPTSDNCTDLDSWYLWGDFTTFYAKGHIPALDALGMTPLQQATAMMIQDAALACTVWNLVDELGPAALTASSYISRQELFWSPVLSPIQWQIEAANWFATNLAHLQRLFISNYRTPSVQLLRDNWIPFRTDDDIVQRFCNSQKVRNTAYTSFSVLGLAIDFGVGGLLLLASVLVPYVVPKLQARRGQKGGRSLARDQWMMNSALQLQRVLFGLLSAGDWKEEEYGDEGVVPVTKTAERISPPPLVDARNNPAAVVQLGVQGDGGDEDGALLGVKVAGVTETFLPSSAVSEMGVEVYTER